MSDLNLNYTTHAIEGLLQLTPAMRQKGCRKSARSLEALAGLMKEATKFSLPNRGELVALESLGEDLAEFVRLPLEAVCLETPFTSEGGHLSPVYRGDDDFKESASSKRVSVAWTAAVRPRYPGLCEFDDKPGFYVASVYYDDADRTWLACPMLNFIPANPSIGQAPVLPSKGYQAMEYAFLQQQGTVRANGRAYECQSALLMPEFVEMMAQEFKSHDKALARFSIDIRDETATAIAFCLAANASNIERLRLEPCAKLNKRRLASGRVPFYETWMLSLKSPNETSRDESARVHLHKGQLRREGRQRLTYVEPTLP